LGCSLAFGAGLAVISLFSAFVSSSQMTTIEKAIISASPSVSGTLWRFVGGVQIAKNGGRKFTLFMLFLTLAGLLMNWLVSRGINPVELNATRWQFYG